MKGVTAGKIEATILYRNGRVIRADWPVTRWGDGRLTLVTLAHWEPDGLAYWNLEFDLRPEETRPHPKVAGWLCLGRKLEEEEGRLERVEVW